MCIQCHSSLSDQMVCDQITEQINAGSKYYHLYNSTSISHFLIATGGYNGIEVKKKAEILLKKYINWLKEHPRFIINQSLSPENLLKEL
jgi:hypothetical protein